MFLSIGMLKQKYFLADIFILSAEKQPIKLSWRKIECLHPVEKIRQLAEEEKKRSALTVPDIQKLRKYLHNQNPHFLFLCQFAYYTFIRPDEISNIRLADINLKEQKVFIGSSISKNRKDGMVGLNDALIKSMLDLGVFNSPNDYYLFGKASSPHVRR